MIGISCSSSNAPMRVKCIQRCLRACSCSSPVASSSTVAMPLLSRPLCRRPYADPYKLHGDFRSGKAPVVAALAGRDDRRVLIPRPQRRSVPSPPPLTGVDGGGRRQRGQNTPGSYAPRVDARVARLATEQDGVADRTQLLALGLTRAAIDHWVRSGRLILIHRGVYAVGHAALTRRGRLRAALMAAGSNAVLSHLTAAATWGLTSSMPPFVEVTVTRKGPRSRPGLVIHETRRPPDVALVGALPVTAPLRTLADLKAA